MGIKPSCRLGYIHRKYCLKLMTKARELRQHVNKHHLTDVHGSSQCSFTAFTTGPSPLSTWGNGGPRTMYSVPGEECPQVTTYKLLRLSPVPNTSAEVGHQNILSPKPYHPAQGPPSWNSTQSTQQLAPRLFLFPHHPTVLFTKDVEENRRIHFHTPAHTFLTPSQGSGWCQEAGLWT